MDFILGHPRSGTAYLAKLINLARPNYAFHELLVYLRPETIGLATAFYEGTCEAAAIRDLLGAYDTARRWLLGHRQDALQIDANWKLSFIMPVLLECHPEARIVHVSRDPRENVAACLGLGYYTGVCDDPRYFSGRPLEVARLISKYWLSMMPKIRRADWADLSPLGRNCAFWAETHRLIVESSAHRSTYRHVRLEDLEGDSCVQSVCSFLGLEAPSGNALRALRAERVNSKELQKSQIAQLVGESANRRWKEWSAEEHDVFERICGPMARDLGYSV